MACGPEMASEPDFEQVTPAVGEDGSCAYCDEAQG